MDFLFISITSWRANQFVVCTDCSVLLMRTTPLFDYNTVYLFTCWWHWVVSNFFFFTIIDWAAIDIEHGFFREDKFSFLWHKYPAVGWLGQIILITRVKNACLETAKVYPRVTVPVCILHNSVWESLVVPHFYQLLALLFIHGNTYSLILICFSHSTICSGITFGFNLHFLNG